jgi:DNA polymerase-3 subunit epsilon
MQQYSWWGADNPPPHYLKTVKQLEKLGLYPKKAEAVIYLKKGKPVYLFNPRSADSVMLAETFKAKHQYDRAIASSWARNLLTRDFLILDTETTGLKKPEICQIAITDNQGNPLVNTLVKPCKPIDKKAQAVHGISNSDVKNAPTFMEIYPEIVNLITCQELVIYNKDFDIAVLNNCSPRPIIVRQFTDPMPYYAAWKGDWNYYRAEYKYPKLEGNHDAYGDCLQTLSVIKTMANNS